MLSASFDLMLLPLWMSTCNFKLKRHQIKLPTFTCKPVPLLASLFMNLRELRLEQSFSRPLCAPWPSAEQSCPFCLVESLHGHGVLITGLKDTSLPTLYPLVSPPPTPP